MAEVTFKGTPVKLLGDIPEEGEAAGDFTVVREDLSELRFSDIRDKIKIIIAVPSLDTSVCATETLNFSQKLADKPDVVALVVSKDLPFAMKRYMEKNGIENIISGSDFRYGEFVKTYKTEMTEGPLKGLSARAVFVVDKDGVIRYTELTPEIAQEPQYDKALNVVDSLMYVPGS